MATPSSSGSNGQGEYSVLRDLTETETLERLPPELLVDLGIAKNGIPDPAEEPHPQRKVRHPGRHAHLLGIAGAMRGRGETEKAILKELRRVNKAVCEPPKPDEDLIALARDLTRRYEETAETRYEVTWTNDKTPKLILPALPEPDDTPGLCQWLTSTLRLSPVHPVKGAVHRGLRGSDGQVDVLRAGELPIRFEPAGLVSTSRRLLTALGWQLQPGDGEPYGFKDEHARRIAHALRLLCGASREADEKGEARGIVVTFLGHAKEIEGHTTYGTDGQSYEAATALRGEIDEGTGRQWGASHYLTDANTGEYVIRVEDLQAAARRYVGSSLPRGWLDGRMTLLDWQRIEIRGYSLPEREGRKAGMHARCGAYRGVLPDDGSEPVCT